MLKMLKRTGVEGKKNRKLLYHLYTNGNIIIKMRDIQKEPRIKKSVREGTTNAFLK